MHDRCLIKRLGGLKNLVLLLLLNSSWIAGAQTIIFNQNFDGGYAGAFGTSSYHGGSPAGTTNQILATGGNPTGCWRETMMATTAGDYYAGQLQLMTVSGNTDTNPSNYEISFDAYGSQAANFQFLIQTWASNYFSGGGPIINVSVNDKLTSANTWQTFKVNLGTLTTASPTGATWQFSLSMSAAQWGGVGPTSTLWIDNLKLTHLANPLAITSSANPGTLGAGVSFTTSILTNGTVAGNATGNVVFSSFAGPFSTNPVVGGQATSLAYSNLPVGISTITAVYSGGNYAATTNSMFETIPVPTAPSLPQTNLVIYNDKFVNAFWSSSWATVNKQNPSPTHSGSYSFSVSDAGYQALGFGRAAFNTTPYASLSFWIHGGASGGQQLVVKALLDGKEQPAFAIAAPAAKTWRQVIIPLSSLGAANKANCTGFWIQGNTATAQTIYYVDDVQLVAAAPPATIHVTADAGQPLRTVDARQFGVNTATWDGILGNSQTLPLLRLMGCMALRWPGGSTSDAYHWANDPSGNATFRSLAKGLGAQVFTTVNYGSGTAAEAAAWVLDANKTNQCGFIYWEIGNECYGSWETDNHAIPQDPYTYATNAVAYIQAMKQAYPSVPIKVGIVVVPGEDAYANNATHSALNPRTHVSHTGWTPVVLSQMNSLGVLPDFLIYHCYPQYTVSGTPFYSDTQDSDAYLLQVAANPDPVNFNDWASAAASLRQQITDYLGAANGSNIELCVTENNSDAGAMGRQSTSLINALYLADSTSQLMKTEFKSYIWWDLHNGAQTDGNLDPSVYGWRNVGDYGVLNGANLPYPTYYAAKLLQHFARPGDVVLGSGSDHLLMSATAVRRTNGSLTLLVINKHETSSLSAQVGLQHFVPATAATLYSYGLPQDEASRTNGPSAAQDLSQTTVAIAGTNFTYLFPPLSINVLSLPPAPSSLLNVVSQPPQIQMTLQGQPGVTYVLEKSADLKTWTPVSTNTLAGPSVLITLNTNSGAVQQYYRSVWKP